MIEVTAILKNSITNSPKITQRYIIEAKSFQNAINEVKELGLHTEGEWEYTTRRLSERPKLVI